jgi:hypothetical protein
LLVEGKKRANAGRAHGREVPGGWLKSDGGTGGAVGWRIDDSGQLVTLELHDPKRFEWTSAVGAGGGAFVGYGQHKAKKGTREKDRALFWHSDDTLVELAAPNEIDAPAYATDGATAVGRIGQKAVLWNVDGSEPIILGSDGKISEAQGVRDGEQVGSSWQGMRGRAALWCGSAASCVDLTPRKHESAAATDCARACR